MRVIRGRKYFRYGYVVFVFAVFFVMIGMPLIGKACPIVIGMDTPVGNLAFNAFIDLVIIIIVYNVALKME